MMFGEGSQMAVDSIRIVTQSSVKGRHMNDIAAIDLNYRNVRNWRNWENKAAHLRDCLVAIGILVDPVN
jgi:hypothetical protein